MKDLQGNDLPKTYEYSVQARCYDMAETLRRANMLLARAVTNPHNTTKAEMATMINAAASMILEVEQELIGRG